MEDIQVFRSDVPGFCVTHFFHTWQIGTIRYTEKISRATLERLEKHAMTDESFVLARGEASLFIGRELKEVKMKNGFIYNVPRNVWHTITLSEDACVFVVENVNTEKEDKIPFN